MQIMVIYFASCASRFSKSLKLASFSLRACVRSRSTSLSCEAFTVRSCRATYGTITSCCHGEHDAVHSCTSLHGYTGSNHHATCMPICLHTSLQLWPAPCASSVPQKRPSSLFHAHVPQSPPSLLTNTHTHDSVACTYVTCMYVPLEHGN